MYYGWYGLKTIATKQSREDRSIGNFPTIWFLPEDQLRPAAATACRPVRLPVAPLRRVRRQTPAFRLELQAALTKAA
jgi:hypothetical protein